MADDELTDAEKAYLESGGENADGLLTEQGAAGGEAAKPAEAEPVAEPAAQAEATAAAIEADDDEAPKDPKATVPYGKYSRERKKARAELDALKKQLAERDEKWARGDERLRLLSEALQAQPQQEQPAEPEDPEPDPNEDIIGWANWSRRERERQAKTIDDLRGGVQQSQSAMQATAAEQQIRETYQADAMAFAKEKPDFVQAYIHMISTRANMLVAQGYPEPQVRQILRNEEKDLVQQALQAGKRPAAHIYEMAKFFGYAPTPAAAAAAQNGAAAPQNGAQNGAAPARTPSVVEEIERIQRGQAAGKSLSGTGGAAQELTVEALANMNDREFEALYAGKRGEIDALLGRRH